MVVAESDENLQRAAGHNPEEMKMLNFMRYCLEFVAGLTTKSPLHLRNKTEMP